MPIKANVSGKKISAKKNCFSIWESWPETSRKADRSVPGLIIDCMEKSFDYMYYAILIVVRKIMVAR